MKRFLSMIAAGFFALSATNAEAQVTQVVNNLILANGANTVTLSQPTGGGARSFLFPNSASDGANLLFSASTGAQTITAGGLTLGAGVGFTLTGFTQGNILFAGSGGVVSEDVDFSFDATTNIFSLGAGASIRIYEGDGGGQYVTFDAPNTITSNLTFTLPTTGGELVVASSSATPTFGELTLGEDDATPVAGKLHIHDNTDNTGDGFTQTIQVTDPLTVGDAILTLPNTAGVNANVILSTAASAQTIGNVSTISRSGDISVTSGSGNDVILNGGLINTSNNNLVNDNFGDGQGANALVWATSGTGFAATITNESTTANATTHPNGLAVKVYDNTTNTVAFNISQSNAVGSGGTQIMNVLGNGNITMAPTAGNVVIGSGTGTISVQTTNIDISTAGAITGATGLTTTNNVVIDGGTDLTIGEGGLSRATNIAINPGASNFVTTDGTFLGNVAGSTAADGTLTLTASTSTTAPTGTNNAILMRVGDADSYVTAIDIDHDGTVNMADVNITGGTITGVTLSGMNTLSLGAESATPVAGTLALHDGTDNGAVGTAGELKGTIQTATALTADRTYTMPDASGTVMLESTSGNVTLGNDTDPDRGSITFHDNTGGNGFTQTIQAASNAGQTTTITIPDPGTATAEFVLTAGNQTVAGTKTFTSALTQSLTDASTGAPSDLEVLSHTSSGTPLTGFGGSILTKLEDGSNNPAEDASRITTYWFDPTNGSEDARLSINLKQGGTNTEVFVLDENGNLAIDGNLTSGGTGYLKLSAGSSQLLTGNLFFDGATTGNGFETEFAVTDPTTDRTITFPNATGTVMLQSAGGNVTLGDGTAPTQGSITLHDNNNTNSNAITLQTAAGPLTGNYTYTLPDVGASASFVMTEGAQTVNGVKTFTSALTNATSDAATSSATDQLTLSHATSGTAATDFGTSILTQLEDAAGNTPEDATRITSYWFDATAGSEDARISFNLKQGGSMTEVMVLQEDGDLQIDGSLTSSGSLSSSSSLTLGVESLAPTAGTVVFHDGTDNNADGAATAFTGTLGVTNPLTANRTWSLPDAGGTLATTANLSSYLALSGGTMTGDIVLDGNDLVGDADANGVLSLIASTNASNTGTAMTFKVGNSAGTTAMTILHSGQVTIPNLQITGTFDGDFTLTKEAAHSIFVANTTTANTDGGDLTIGGGNATGTGDGGDVILDPGSGDPAGVVRFNGKMAYKVNTYAAAAALDFSTEESNVIRITNVAGVQANVITTPTNPVDGQVIYIVNQDDDATTGFSVAANATGMFVYFASGASWVRVLP